MLRWFGFSRVTSLPPIAMLPAVGSSKPGDHAEHGRLAAARRPEEGDELAALDVEVEVLDHGGVGEGLADVLDAEEGFRHRVFLSQFGRLADRGAKRERTWITDMQPQVMAKAMIASAAGS